VLVEGHALHLAGKSAYSSRDGAPPASRVRGSSQQRRTSPCDQAGFVVGLLMFCCLEGNRNSVEPFYTPARRVFLCTTHCVALLSSLVTGLDAMQNKPPADELGL